MLQAEHGLAVTCPDFTTSTLRQIAGNLTAGPVPTDLCKIIELEGKDLVRITVPGLVVEVDAWNTITLPQDDEPRIIDKVESTLIGALLALSCTDFQIAAEYGLAIVKKVTRSYADLIGGCILVPATVTQDRYMCSLFPAIYKLRMVTDRREIKRLLTGDHKTPPLYPFTVVLPPR